MAKRYFFSDLLTKHFFNSFIFFSILSSNFFEIIANFDIKYKLFFAKISYCLQNLQNLFIDHFLYKFIYRKV